VRFRSAEDEVYVEPDPAEQAVLSEIRQLREGGTTQRGIAAINHCAF